MKHKRRYRPYAGRLGSFWLRALLIVVLAGVVCFAVLAGLVRSGERDELHGEPKLMIILGCKVESWGPSLLLQDRLDTALDYLASHPDMTVVVSGGKGDDEHMSEAQCMYDYLTGHGIDESRVFLEDQSRNTLQNFRFSRTLLEQLGHDVTEGVLVVSNGFHLTRARMLARRVGFSNVSTLAAPSSHLPSRIHMFFREPLALVKSFLLDR